MALRGQRVVMQYFELKRDRLFDALLNFFLRLAYSEATRQRWHVCSPRCRPLFQDDLYLGPNHRRMHSVHILYS